MTHTGTSPKNVLGALDDEMDEEELRSILSKGGSSHNLAAKIQAVFKKIMDNSMLEKRTYWKNDLKMSCVLSHMIAGREW